MVGAVGYCARGVVFGLIGAFLIKAAVEYDPEEAIALDGALGQARATPPAGRSCSASSRPASSPSPCTASPTRATATSRPLGACTGAAGGGRVGRDRPGVGPGRDSRGGRMADRMLMITWGALPAGRRSARSTRSTKRSGSWAAASRPARSSPSTSALMQPNGELDGYMIVKGSAEQILALRESDDFRRNTVEAVAVRRRPPPHRGLLRPGRRRGDGDVHGGDRGRSRRHKVPGVRPMPIVGIQWACTNRSATTSTPSTRGRDVPRLLGAAAVADGTHPAAREWVRRWGPARALTALPDCACAAGRCGICN